MKNKKVVWIIIGIISIALIALAITYAYWQITKSQTNSNVISSACLDISLVDAESDNAGITLQEQFPISDDEGKELAPYKFTITNNCDTSVDYQIALESIGDSTTALKATSLKVMLDDSTSLLSSNETVTTTVSGAYASHKLGMGTLAKSGETGSSVTHELRLWIDESAPVSENNKTYNGKITVTIGQEIIKTFNLGEQIIANAGGVSTISTLDSKAVVDEEIGNSYIQLTSEAEFYYGTEYSYDETTGMYSLAGDISMHPITDCIADATACGNYTFMRTEESFTASTIYEITEWGSYSVYFNIRGKNKFSESYTAGLYKTNDNYGNSYYFRGNVTNNYVEFGKWNEDIKIIYAYFGGLDPDLYTGNSMTECEQAIKNAGLEIDGDHVKCVEYLTVEKNDNMNWRIVRINGDGSIRLVYDGADLVENGVEHNASIANDIIAPNQPYGHKMYVGYMYGTESDPYANTNDSDIKDIIDNWYETYLKTDYEKYISDTIFCNDREEMFYMQDDDLYYRSHERSVNNSPTLICGQQNDRFTVDDEVVGNGDLTNPIGLLSYDEVMMAGNLGYLAGEEFWTMSYQMFAGYPAVQAWLVYNGSIQSYNIDYMSSKYAVRPVINIKADVKFRGSGTITDPYVLVE